MLKDAGDVSRVKVGQEFGDGFVGCVLLPLCQGDNDVREQGNMIRVLRVLPGVRVHRLIGNDHVGEAVVQLVVVRGICGVEVSDEGGGLLIVEVDMRLNLEHLVGRAIEVPSNYDLGLRVPQADQIDYVG